MLDARFLSAVEELRAPTAGTETMAPLLYSLVRSARPRCVVEVGTGYTTPFLLQALADNRRDFQRDRELLKTKSKPFLGLGPGGRLLRWNAPKKRRFGADVGAIKWLKTEPYAADPDFYLRDYEPHLYAFDDYTWEPGSAPKVIEVIEKLELRDLLTFVQSDPMGQSSVIDEKHLPIDFAWNDASSYWGFFQEYWDLINPDGGLLLLHNTVNSQSLGNAIIAKNLKLQQVSRFNEFEILSVLEPHKMNQNGFTMIRKISGFRERYLDYRWAELRDKAKRLVEGKNAE